MFDDESGSVTDYLPGDILLRRKGPVMHQGIALGDDHVLHNTPRRGEHVSTMEDFRRGKTVRARRLGETQRARALHHAEHAAQGEHPQRYNLFRNNCEHTVTRATTGNATSPQLLAVAAGLVVGGVVLAVTRHPVAAAAIGYALCRKLRKPR